MILLNVYVNSTVVKPKQSRERVRSEKIDRILTGKYTAIPCFIGIMVLVFYLTFNVIGAWLQEILEIGIDAVVGDMVESGLLTAANVNECHSQSGDRWHFYTVWEVCSVFFR